MTYRGLISFPREDHANVEQSVDCHMHQEILLERDIPSFRIRAYRVVRLIPKRAAAPFGPMITPRVCCSVLRMCSRFKSSRVMGSSGEKESEDGKRFPSDLAKSGAIKKTPDGFTYIDPAQFHELFAADLPNDRAAFMERSQVFNFADNFSATITTAAWRNKPSWMVVAGSDRTISPDLERWYAKRANSHAVEVAGASHSVYVSHPKEVADVIESAARALSK